MLYNFFFIRKPFFVCGFYTYALVVKALVLTSLTASFYPQAHVSTPA